MDEKALPISEEVVAFARPTNRRRFLLQNFEENCRDHKDMGH
jgi:hypothetical protein